MMPKRALVLIDIQNDYFPGGKWPLSGIDAAADNAAKLQHESPATWSSTSGTSSRLQTRHSLPRDPTEPESIPSCACATASPWC